MGFLNIFLKEKSKINSYDFGFNIVKILNYISNKKEQNSFLIFVSHFGQYTYRSSIFWRSIICKDTILILHIIPINIRLTMSSITPTPPSLFYYKITNPILSSRIGFILTILTLPSHHQEFYLSLLALYHVKTSLL